MEELNGWWVESVDVSRAGWVKESAADLGILAKATEHCHKHRVAVDVGANVGRWAKPMSEAFERVEAFEPYTPSMDCLAKNLAGRNVGFHPIALMDYSGEVDLYLEVRSHFLQKQNRGERISVPCATLDSLGIGPVDLIKIDVDGNETAVIEGAGETINKHRPIIILEVKRLRNADQIMRAFEYEPIVRGRIDTVYYPC